MAFYLRQTFRFQENHVSVTSELESWLTTIGKNATKIEITRYSISSFLKTTDLNSSIEVWIDGDIDSNVSLME